MINKKLFPFILAIILASFSCTAQDLKKNNPKKEFSKIDFLHDCGDLKISCGSIMGVEFSDSTKMYYMGECNSNYSYELIFVLDSDLNASKKKSYDELKKIFFDSKKQNYVGFSCYAFVIPKLKEDPIQDMHDGNLLIPSLVKVYKRDQNKKWGLVKSVMINTFEEYGRLRLNTFYIIFACFAMHHLFAINSI